MSKPYLRFLLIPLLTASLAFAQLNATSAPDTADKEGLIKLDVLVTEQAGKPVSGLGLKDFTLLDNNQPQKILSFQANSGSALSATIDQDSPVELLLLVDSLNLRSQQAASAEREVENFLRQNNGRLPCLASVYWLSSIGLSVTSNPSTNGNALAAEIAQKTNLHVLWEVKEQSDHPISNGRSGHRIPESNQANSVHSPSDPRQLSLRALGSIAIAERMKPGRKLMVWVGYGWPVTGYDLRHANHEQELEQVVEFSTWLREARIVLSSVTSWPYPVLDYPYQELLKPKKSAQSLSVDRLIQSQALEVLATQSGGRVLGPGNDLAALINKSVEDAGSFYTISFDPPRAAELDEHHELKLLPASTALVARANSGYFDQPSFYDQLSSAFEHRSVSELEQVLANSHGSLDADVARKLSGMELTERLNSTKLLSWKARLPGPKSWAALVALADVSAFLNPPADEILPTAPPDHAAQQRMVSKTVDYLSNAIPRLPNFFATRTTVHYDEATRLLSQADKPLQIGAVSSTTVSYREGREVTDAKRRDEQEDSLFTRGTFGPILGTIFQDASDARGGLTWSRWEQGTAGPQAVFLYAVPKENSHYEIAVCCFPDEKGMSKFQRLPGYHGEIAIDPATGAILRVTVVPDLQPAMPVTRFDIMVEYGPVEIGGITYICPVKSVTLARERSRRLNHFGSGDFKMGEYIDSGPLQTMLNDVSFGPYHIFRSEVRLLTDNDQLPDEKDGNSGSNGTRVSAHAKQP